MQNFFKFHIFTDQIPLGYNTLGKIVLDIQSPFHSIFLLLSPVSLGSLFSETLISGIGETVSVGTFGRGT